MYDPVCWLSSAALAQNRDIATTRNPPSTLSNAATARDPRLSGVYAAPPKNISQYASAFFYYLKTSAFGFILPIV